VRRFAPSPSCSGESKRWSGTLPFRGASRRPNRAPPVRIRVQARISDRFLGKVALASEIWWRLSHAAIRFGRESEHQ